MADAVPTAMALQPRRSRTPSRRREVTMPATADAILEDHEGRVVLRFERVLRHPPERVWSALTEVDDLRQWHPSPFELERRAGGAVAFEPPAGVAFGPGVVRDLRTVAGARAQLGRGRTALGARAVPGGHASGVDAHVRGPPQGCPRRRRLGDVLPRTRGVARGVVRRQWRGRPDRGPRDDRGRLGRAQYRLSGAVRDCARAGDAGAGVFGGVRRGGAAADVRR